ncbi:ATP synthase gamma chain 1, chloroplastic, partial [Cucurbita argyrosperma subsp. sororia]
MVEIQACATGLVNPSALCAAIDQESKGENMNVIARMADELHRERQRNAKLMERISFLEAKLLQGRVKDPELGDELGSCSKRRSFKRLKRSREEAIMKDGTQFLSPKEVNLEDRLVSWMSMDETQFVHYEKLKECDNTVDCVDSDETDNENDYYHEESEIPFDIKDWETNGNSRSVNGVKQDIYHDSNSERMENQSGPENKPTFVDDQTETKETGKKLEPKSERNETKNSELYDRNRNILGSGNDVGFGSVSLQRKPPKLAFCPKEVKGIIESEALLQRNAQSHTMRKIIVFSCLGIRHGCEEMYELDFNHFSIIRKGEPFISPQNPGEHVLYENPGVRRKILYPNRHHPTLCPVQILEEEKAMRPLDVNCPSCLFLCIKYGGRTRNLPQNEYVRQRMGRNKLKSFGPLMCRMARLANPRSGSFFFKALGITLLFMAGFPDDLVRKETKYRNLDLLQKYYRTDKDAVGEELFLARSTADSNDDKFVQEQLAGNTISTKSRGKKNKLAQANSLVLQIKQHPIWHHLQQDLDHLIAAFPIAPSRQKLWKMQRMRIYQKKQIVILTLLQAVKIKTQRQAVNVLPDLTLCASQRVVLRKDGNGSPSSPPSQTSAPSPAAKPCPAQTSQFSPVHCGLRELRDRIDSVKNTQKITEAMKLVAAVKVRRAQEAVVNGRPFSEALVEVLYNINEQLQTEDIDTPLTKVRPVKKVTLVVVTGDRGLCGGFNNSIIKKAEARISELKEMDLDSTVISVGKKGNTYFLRRPYIPVDKFLEGGTLPTAKEAQAIADDVFSLFDPVQILDALLPLYLNSHILRSLQESLASELAARMSAMSNATDNASELKRTRLCIIDNAKLRLPEKFWRLLLVLMH